jgi:superfamily II DNA or RNA helicase
MTASPPRSELGRLGFRGEWRRYQELALDAFEHDRRQGRRRTHIVAPPGSGKTLLGMEIVRRLGKRALVLAPNSAIQAQWLRAAAVFGAEPGLAAADAEAAIACLTYQALARLDDPAVAVGDLAERRWAMDRARSTGRTLEEVEREARAWTGDASARRKREIARITASLKREIARAEHGDLRLGDLLSGGARERLNVLRRNGVGTIVLDECHHLASLWGYVVRAAVEELGDAHLVGLTATPPDELTREEAELYEALLGPVDFTVPTPAVVRERFLAPYQELAWLTPLLETERAWLAEHDLRFQELVTTLHDESGDAMSLPAWVITRMRERGRDAQNDAAVPWSSFQRRHPALARAGARFFASAGLELPPGVPRGEGYREQPSLDDWLVLLEDYALHCLAADSSSAAAARYQAIAAALRSLGFTLTRQGIRRGASEVDRLLTNSAAKSIALTEVVGCEYDARGERLRALVLADAERTAVLPDESLALVLRSEAGTAPEAVRALASDGRTGALRPLLVSGRGLRCAEHDADVLLDALRDHAGGSVTGWATEPGGDDLVRLTATGPGWQPRLWVELATRMFADGVTQVLVGTRALLGEGWDAPCVNCLVDLSAATTSVSVTQMRGRSLRLDPDDPDKIASNWDIVAVAPELARGTADYERFVRKHLHLFAPSEDGAIEAGPSHVHPGLGPFSPPAEEEFDEINRTMTRRAAEHEQARARWRIGEPYVGQEQPTLVLRSRAAGTRRQTAETPPAYPIKQHVPFGVAAAVGVASPTVAAYAHDPLALAALVAVPAALGWAARRLGRTQRELADALPIDLVAHAICDAYRELGELTDGAAGSLAIEPRASGFMRCFLRSATPEESARFVRALDSALSPVELPRYLVSRLVADPPRSHLALLARTLTRRPPFQRRWVPVPDDFGRRKERAEVFANAWRRWLGPTELRFTQRSAEGKEALAAANAQAVEYETSTRRVWT